jgi:hypothetical protein
MQLHAYEKTPDRKDAETVSEVRRCKSLLRMHAK